MASNNNHQALRHAQEQAIADRQRTVLQAKIDREYEKHRKAAERDILNLDRPERIKSVITTLIVAFVLLILIIGTSGVAIIPIAIYYLYKKNK
jgi:hypothetical protein